MSVERITEWRCQYCGATFKSAADFLRWETPRGEVTGHRRLDSWYGVGSDGDGMRFGTGEWITCGPIVAVVPDTRSPLTRAMAHVKDQT